MGNFPFGDEVWLGYKDVDEMTQPFIIPHWIPLFTHLGKPPGIDEGGPLGRKSYLLGGPKYSEQGSWILGD